MLSGAFITTEAVVWRCSVKKVFLEISQDSQESTCARVSFVVRPQPATLLKKGFWHRCFPVNLAKFLRTPFLKEHFRWLLLLLDCFIQYIYDCHLLVNCLPWESYFTSDKHKSLLLSLLKYKRSIRNILFLSTNFLRILFVLLLIR